MSNVSVWSGVGLHPGREEAGPATCLLDGRLFAGAQQHRRAARAKLAVSGSFSVHLLFFFFTETTPENTFKKPNITSTAGVRGGGGG